MESARFLKSWASQSEHERPRLYVGGAHKIICMGDEIDARAQSIDACSCPREPGERLIAPQCQAERYVHGYQADSPALLFVRGRPNCRHFISFGDGHLCMCAQRVSLYKTYSV